MSIKNCPIKGVDIFRRSNQGIVLRTRINALSCLNSSYIGQFDHPYR